MTIFVVGEGCLRYVFEAYRFKVLSKAAVSLAAAALSRQTCRVQLLYSEEGFRGIAA